MYTLDCHVLLGGCKVVPYAFIFLRSSENVNATYANLLLVCAYVDSVTMQRKHFFPLKAQRHCPNRLVKQPFHQLC